MILNTFRHVALYLAVPLRFWKTTNGFRNGSDEPHPAPYRGCSVDDFLASCATEFT